MSNPTPQEVALKQAQFQIDELSNLIERLRQKIIVDGMEMPGNDALHREAGDALEAVFAEIRQAFEDGYTAAVDLWARHDAHDLDISRALDDAWDRWKLAGDDSASDRRDTADSGTSGIKPADSESAGQERRGVEDDNSRYTDGDSDADRRTHFYIGVDLARPGSDVTAFICSRCKTPFYTAQDAERHECNPAATRRERLYHFDRYHGHRRMAQGCKVQASSEEEARDKAKKRWPDDVGKYELRLNKITNTAARQQDQSK